MIDAALPPARPSPGGTERAPQTAPQAATAPSPTAQDDARQTAEAVPPAAALPRDSVQLSPEALTFIDRTAAAAR